MILGWVDRIDVCIGRSIVRQDFNEFVAGDVLANIPFCSEQDAKAIKCPLDCDAAVIRREVATHLDHMGVVLVWSNSLAAVESQQAESFVTLANGDELMASEIGVSFRRSVVC